MEASMSDQASPVTAYVEVIREASHATKLTALSELACNEQDLAGMEVLLSAQAEDDIKLMRGSRDLYYFSDKYMTSAYALHLFRVAEKDPARMIADTVRDESRIYPRPTPIASFLEAPFRMSKAALDGVLWQISQRNDMEDIKSTTASDGSIYLYSNEYLSAAHADSLAEWEAVGKVENP
ncbi:MAG: hypothetical protein A3J97_11840 [Spirochaetes bacterium RIFOXYC1_FULL_54_7]|nr:MAG: hypothetical protein A3J97_11840 [Spirochaetes bacterium RIFOXYC1_FULL_54_7]